MTALPDWMRPPREEGWSLQPLDGADEEQLPGDGAPVRPRKRQGPDSAEPDP